MEWIALLALAVLSTVALAIRRRRRDAARQRNRDEIVRQLTEFASSAEPFAGSAVTVRPAGRYRVAFGRGSTPTAGDARLELPYERCAAAQPSELLAGVAYLLSENPSPHDEPLVLRRQGREIAPLVVRRSWLPAFPGEFGVPSTALGDSDLAAIYRLTSRAGLRFLSGRSLEETGITVADLHGAVEAMLRQRLDDEAVRRAVTGEMVEIEDDPASAAAAQLFVIPGELGPEHELLAAVAAADRTALGPPDAVEALERWLEREASGGTPLSTRLLRLGASGIAVLHRSSVSSRPA